MKIFLLGTTIGFAISVIIFALAFSRAKALGWLLAAVANIPNLILLSYLSPSLDGSRNPAGFLVFGVVALLGGGGFGLGAIVGMMIATARTLGVEGEPSESVLGKQSNDFRR